MLPALIDDLSRLPASSLLQGTLLGHDFLLLGLDVESQVVVRQPLRRADEALALRRADPVPVVHFADGHPLAQSFTSGATVRNAVLYLRPEGWSATADDAPQTIEAWALLGGEGAEVFPLGALVTVDDEQAAKAAGQLWCYWEVAPVTVYPRQRLPFSPTDSTGMQSRKVLTGLTSVDADPLTYQARAAGPSNDHLLAFDVRALLETLPQDRYLDDLTGLGNAVRGLAGRLLVRRFGEDAGESPLITLPVCDETLFDPTANGDALLARVLDEGQEVRSSYVDITTDTVRNLTTTKRYFHFKEGFTLPSGRGLKVTLRVAASGQGAGIKLCRAGRPYAQSAGLIEVVSDTTAPWERRVSSYTGTRGVGGGIDAALQLRDDTGRTLPLLKGQRYEIYIYPDRHAYVFANGVYIHRLRVNAQDWVPGGDLTFRMAAVAGELALHELRAEAFPVPADYLLESPVPPRITMMDWAHATSVNEDYLAVDNTSVGFLLDRSHAYAEFVVTEPCRFSMRAYLHRSPSTETAKVRLYSVDAGTSYSDTLIDELNGWHVWSGTLSAGKYRLSLSNGTYDVPYTEYYDCDYYSSCKWSSYYGKYQCYNGSRWVNISRTPVPSGSGWKACSTRTAYETKNTYHYLRVYHWKAEPV